MEKKQKKWYLIPLVVLAIAFVVVFVLQPGKPDSIQTIQKTYAVQLPETAVVLEYEGRHSRYGTWLYAKIHVPAAEMLSIKDQLDAFYSDAYGGLLDLRKATIPNFGIGCVWWDMQTDAIIYGYHKFDSIKTRQGDTINEIWAFLCDSNETNDYLLYLTCRI